MFIYWSNKTAWHEAKIMEVEAEDLSEADKKFEEEVHLNPAKTPWISCRILKEQQ